MMVRDVIREKWNEISYGFNDKNIFKIKVIAVSASYFDGEIMVEYEFRIIPRTKSQSYALLTRYVPKGIELVSAKVMKKPDNDMEYDPIDDMNNDYLSELIYNGVVNALKSTSKRNVESLQKWGHCEYHYSYAYIQNESVENMTMDLILYPEGYTPVFDTWSVKWEELIVGESDKQ